MTSAAEAEMKGVFQNAKSAVPICYLLSEIGHPQPQTLIRTDNSTAAGFVNNNIQMKRSKSWVMNFYWRRDKETLKQFKIMWTRGSNSNPNLNNGADYFAKHHTTVHHRNMRKVYITDSI